MADLGVIKTADANTGIRPVAGAPLGAAIGNALNRTSEIVETAVVDSFDNQAQDLLAEANVPEVIEPVVTEEPVPSEVSNIYKSIDRNLSAINKGSVSQVDLAKLRLTQLLNKAQAKHPAFASQLQARAGQVAAGSSDLAEIALADASRTTAASIATAEYKAITSHARDDLHIDPALQPGSAEFNKQYTTRQADYALQQSTDSQLRLITSLDARSTQETAAAFMPVLQGASSSFGQGLVNEMNAPGGWREYAAELSKPAAEQNPDIIDNWVTVGAAEFEQSVASKIYLLQTGFDKAFPPALRKGDGYTQAKAQVDSWVKQLNDLTATPTDTEGLKTYAQVQSIYAEARVRTLANATPATQQIHDFFANNGGAENMIRAANGAFSGNLKIKNDLANAAAQGLKALMPPTTGVADPTVNSATIATHEVTGQGLITPSMSPQAINNLLTQQQKEGPTVLPKATATEDELLVEAANHLEYSRAVFANIKDIDPKYSSSGAAGLRLTQASSALLAMSHVGNPADDQKEFLLTSFADVELLEAIQVAGDGPDKNRRLAFGSSAQDMYAMTRPEERRQKALAAYNTRFRGGALKDFVTLEIAEGGLYTFTVNKDMLEKALRNETDAKNLGSNAVNTAAQEVIFKMQPIIDYANNDIKAETHIAIANQPSVGDVNQGYYRYNDQLGWMDGLMQ